MDNRQIKDEFISTLSHEIRTPLTSIKGFSKTILDNWDVLDDLSKKKFLNIILEQSERLTNLVENVLDVAKIESDTEIVLKEVNLLALVKSVTEVLKISYKNKEFKIQAEKILNSMADKDKLEQIFVNIIENACKYSNSSAKGVCGQAQNPIQMPIEIKIETRGDFNIVSVKNFGSHIEENEKQNVFKKFYRIDNYLTSSAQGSGLGLYIAKSLIEKMNGKIEINSPEGENFTEFLIYIPVLEPEKMTKKINAAGSYASPGKENAPLKAVQSAQGGQN